MTAPPSRLDYKAMVALVERLNSEGDYGSAPYVNDPDLLCAAADAIRALQKERDEAREKLAGNQATAYEAGLYDGRHGTACEQIRWEQERDSLRSQLDAARGALRKYGKHTGNCSVYTGLVSYRTIDSVTVKSASCTCGLDAASQPGIAAEGAGKTGGEQI